MLDKKILISIVIVLVIGVAAASYQATTKTPGVWQSGVAEQQLPTEQGSTGSDGSSALTSTSSSSGIVQKESQSSSSSGHSGSNGITTEQAKALKIANAGIEDSSITAGTPVLIGTSTYKVTLYNADGVDSGYFIIDTNTGKITEGAGGAPNG
ncbi:MAG: peptidase propeptide domain-containing protein [Methanobacterium sp. ERen5]|nr:MAG: peptidase propeptide domain-containing protein [Methanobacterium sp. ERen5]